MRRWHQDAKIARRNQREHFRIVHNNKPTGCTCDEQPGRFRKRDAYDCGKTQCIICHYDKVFRIPKHQDVKADIDFKEQIDEYRSEKKSA